MWTETHYYRFTDKAQSEAMEVPEQAAVDYVGAIHRPTGEVLETDEGPVVVTQEIPGYHVNARWWGGEPEAWKPYRIAAPENPVRVFA
jgi:hypothetical protein